MTGFHRWNLKAAYAESKRVQEVQTDQSRRVLTGPQN